MIFCLKATHTSVGLRLACGLWCVDPRGKALQGLIPLKPPALFLEDIHIKRKRGSLSVVFVE